MQKPFVFEEQCENGLFTMNLHVLDHVHEGFRSLGGFQLYGSQMALYVNVSTKVLGQDTRKRP